MAMVLCSRHLYQTNNFDVNQAPPAPLRLA